MNSSLHDFKADFFKALGHPLRLRILEALREGEKSVSVLQTELEVEQSTLSQQLGVLRQRGFVSARKDGTLIYYSVKDREVYAFLDLGRALFERHLQHSRELLAVLEARGGAAEAKG